MRRASSASTRIRPVTITPGACPGGWCTANWAGYVVSERAPYIAAQGHWTVPAISSERGAKPADVVAWVGLGGFGANGGGMWQAGTIQTTVQTDSGTFYDATIWYELITTTGGCCPMVVFSGTPVLPGDQFESSVWFGDVDGYEGITGDDGSQYLWAYFGNITQGYSIVTGRQVRDYIDNVYGRPGCCVSGINGGTAEWVVERPYVGPGNGYPTGFSDLANFGNLEFTYAGSFDIPSWEFQPYATQSPLAVGMYHCTTGDCSKLTLTRPLATPSRGCDSGTLDVRHRNFN
ncbi:MAG: G1 family endopeptidase [Polyangiaceae bacterium]